MNLCRALFQSTFYCPANNIMQVNRIFAFRLIKRVTQLFHLLNKFRDKGLGIAVVFDCENHLAALAPWDKDY
jgi:hypothetical protein